MGLFDFAKDRIASVTEQLPTDLVEQATGLDLGGVAESLGQGQSVGEIATDAAQGTPVEPLTDLLP